MKFEMDEKYLDYTLVPAGLLVLGIYHYWLLMTITRHPTRTVIGLNRSSRYRWVYHMMSDPQKNGVLAVQTIRNNLMASTLLATISITLSSLISAVVSGSPSSSKASFTGYTIHQFKYFAVLVCFLVAFFCNMQCTRYYAHVSFLVNVPSPEGRDEYVEYVAQKLNRASIFWSLGLRAFYFSFPLLLWIFGPITMFGCSCLMAFMLYFLDTASLSSRYLPPGFLHKENSNTQDVESVRGSTNNGTRLIGFGFGEIWKKKRGADQAHPHVMPFNRRSPAPLAKPKRVFSPYSAFQLIARSPSLMKPDPCM